MIAPSPPLSYELLEIMPWLMATNAANGRLPHNNGPGSGPHRAAIASNGMVVAPPVGHEDIDIHAECGNFHKNVQPMDKMGGTSAMNIDPRLTVRVV